MKNNVGFSELTVEWIFGYISEDISIQILNLNLEKLEKITLDQFLHKSVEGYKDIDWVFFKEFL